MVEIKPERPIRRFDVFAEYQRLQALKEQQPPDQAKGYAIWLAKVVAARKFSKNRAKAPKEGGAARPGAQEPEEELVNNKWRTLDGVPQTDALFDQEIVRRMGNNFYEKVFSPTIEHAFQSGKDYTEIRDAIRKDWKP